MVIYKYKYIPKEPEITLDKNYKFIDQAITYFHIRHNYLGRRVPFIKCGVELEYDLVTKVYKYIDRARFKVDIYEEQYTQDEEGKDVLVGTTLYMSHTFAIVPMYEKGVYIDIADDQYTTEQMDELKKLEHFEMYLVDLDIVNWFTQEIAVILEDCAYSSAIQAAFVQRDIPKKTIIATPPAKNGKIEHAVTPIQDLIHNIYHMNTAYGLYDCRPIIYHDLEYLYCVAKRMPNIKIKNAKDYTSVVFLLLDPQKPEHEIPGSNDDAQNEIHWVNLRNAPKFRDTYPQETNAQYSTLTSVDSKGKINKTTLDTDATTMKYIYASSDLTEAQILNETMTGPTLALTATNTSVKFLKPYKDYMFSQVGESYKNLDLEGHVFRITGWDLMINRDGTSEYISDIAITLYNPVRGSDDNPKATPSTITR